LLTPTATPADVDHGLIDTLRVGYDYSEHMHPAARHADLVPADMVERFALVGSPTAVADQLTRMLEAGFDHLVIVPRGDFDSVVQRFAEDVVPRL
jgi:alkanesulfonate monooxygenase SsuD/methylene tetrahydromethanopterin reductase-like flavin-dependent oxidoreductase (luciferase family)